ncbi:hypothetical protein N7537_006703 [Penicillium hordei]|uniref:C2H2-type domain-containing protein n=1 Tax=Penicillium hordei TaxID=40994 RepID=A0AAD6H4E5_9EURO|nr:uncharacterized protein N7537_006703 [Penicillium hordei]KAJ5603747.1 hypothetical protein N7537_006703 [Penicillium hordei]
MKLAFMPQVLVARGSEEAYTELTLQISEFSYRLDQCMGLEPDEADTGYASMQEEHRTWPSQLTHDKNKYKGSKRSFKMMLSRKKPRNSLKASFLSVWRKWSKLKAAGGDKTDLNVPEPAASEIGSLFICDCCPKKPKKFDNPDDLRAHEMVKQYSCPYCNHRFKNKNEAERHRNHLHLRRYSWSCATLITFQAAFNASISPYNQTNVGPSHDMCGYCGEEFPNFPQADCNRRFEHLTTMHKFGECSNTKKFYRADHFRQHLKHSHAGTSGKWTDILETACMKEEHARASE